MLGMHARAIHDQRAGVGVEEVVAHAEAVARAARSRRVSLRIAKVGVQHARTGVEPDVGLQVGGAHV